MNIADFLQLKDTIDELSYQLAEAQRQLQLVSGMTGTVVSWDPATHTAVVDLGYETHAIPVGDAPGDFTPLAKGQLVHVIAPSGKLDNAYLIPAGYSGEQTPPSSKAGERVVSLPGGGQFKSLTGNIAHVVAGGVTQFVLVFGGQKFTIKPEALNPA
jgi:phage baseplate assembly protein gpV